MLLSFGFLNSLLVKKNDRVINNTTYTLWSTYPNGVVVESVALLHPPDH